MDRTLFWDQNQSRTFDYVEDDVNTLVSQSNLSQDLLGNTITLLAGLAATPTGPASLNINLASGRIYQIAPIDATANGAISQNLTNVLQQGWAAAQEIAFSTTGIAVGQSRWSLVQAQFSQVDVIRANDPNGGLLYFYNAANTSDPFEGPNDDGQTTPTVREGIITYQVLNGNPATTGAEVPPTPTTGWAPLYLIDLSFGQTTITSGEILVAGPSVGLNVPSNYPQAPFLAGLLQSHHNGTAGQAPQIKLAAEVQGILPNANLYASNTVGGLPTLRLFGGNPNGGVAGNANVNGASDLCFDTLDGFLYVCTTTGTMTTAIWTNLSSGATANFNGGTSAGTANAQTIVSTTPSGFALTTGNTVTFVAGNTNTGATTLNVDSTGVIAINKLSGSSLVPLTGGEITSGAIAVVTYTGSVWELQASGLGTAAYQNVSAFYQTANKLSEVPAAGAVGNAQGNLELLALATTGSANAYVLTYSPAQAGLVVGQSYYGIANFTNTGAATLNINGFGAQPITKDGTIPLIAGDLVSGQVFQSIWDGTEFQLQGGASSGRIRLGATTTYYVSPSGNDTTGTGTSGNPWQTIQHAVNYAANNLDFNGNTVLIQLANGTYAGFFINQPLIGAPNQASFIVQGNTSSPSSTIISSSETCVQAAGGGFVCLQYLQIQSSGGNGIFCGNSGCVSINTGMIFGVCAQSHIATGESGGFLNILGSYSITGGALSHIQSNGAGSMIQYNIGVVCTLTGTPAFSGAFAQSENASEIYALSSSVTFSGGATGTRYLVVSNAVIQTAGGGDTFFPGNSAGIIQTGGQYI